MGATDSRPFHFPCLPDQPGPRAHSPMSDGAVKNSSKKVEAFLSGFPLS
jgi:hypothetical protein